MARSHALVSKPENALALLARAVALSSKAQDHLSSQMDTTDSTTPPNITVTPSSASYLQSILTSQLQHFRALVELHNLTASTKQASASEPFLIDNLNLYPKNGADLKRLVNYPPTIESIPVKPLFFDAAWNYIEYPGRESEITAPAAKSDATHEVKQANSGAEPQKKGWFGFGR